MESSTSFHRIPRETTAAQAHEHAQANPLELGAAHFFAYGLEVYALEGEVEQRNSYGGKKQRFKPAGNFKALHYQDPRRLVCSSGKSNVGLKPRASSRLMEA